MIKELVRIEDELDEIQEEGQRNILEYEAEIQAAKDNLEDTNKAVLEAKKSDDPTEYTKAVAEHRTAKDLMSYYEGKIESIKNKPYITETEYKDYTNEIKQTMNTNNEEALNRAAEIIKELEGIQSELNPAFVKTNKILSKLQNKIYKNSAEKQLKESRETGKSIKEHELNNQYKDDTIKSSIDYILNSHAAKTIKEKGNK